MGHMGYDVAVLGAGISGLNAAWVAAQHLGPGGRLVVIDRRSEVGGMWVDAYPYVRLHQPHPLFTVGDLPWTTGRPPEHLATRDEVLAHLQHCHREIEARAQVQTLLGHEYVGHEETPDLVRITLRAPEGGTVVVEADRFVKALGFEIEPLRPLALSSTQVHSTAPGLLAPGSEALDGDAPVWVVGSGKTAMDTVLHLLDHRPGRRLHMVSGTGTYFTARERALPTGARRWWGGVRLNSLVIGTGRRYDGTNGDEVRRWFIDRVGTSPLEDPRHNVFGILGRAESDRVREGLGEVVRDHLVDVVDEPEGPVMVLRSGARHPVARGSWVVSCLGHFAAKDRPHEPYVSDGGRVASINSSSTTFGFSSFSGYYLAHLLMAGVLADAPLVEVDWDAMQRQAPDEATSIGGTALVHNLSVALELLGPKVLGACGLDFDRWYPPHRLVAGQLDFVLRHKRDRARAARALEVVRERHGFRCGPLQRGLSPSSAPRATA